MTIVGEIVELTNQAYKIWLTRKSESTLNSRELYIKFIEPSYQLLKEIHTDYLELYLELEERIKLENSPLSGTIQWFSKARSRRQMDRSELRSLEIPSLDSQLLRGWDRKDLKGLNQVIGAYLAELREYFLPKQKDLDANHHEQLLMTDENQILSAPFTKATTTRSSGTETFLDDLHLWLEMPHEEKIALLADEYLRAEHDSMSVPLSRDDFIESMLKVTTKEDVLLMPQLEELLTARSEKARQRIRAMSITQSPPSYVEARLGAYLQNFSTKPNWRRIVEDHIRTERSNLERAIGRVQRSFIRVRMLIDR